jgi:NAD(P) transhydrogenase
MGLEDLGIAPDSRGQIAVDENYRTAVPHIYAVGDVIGFPALASAATCRAGFAALHIAGACASARLVRGHPDRHLHEPRDQLDRPTERELTEAGVPYEVGHAQFKSLARAQITGQTVGMLKILFHRETLEILGIHCFGANASEIIHIGQAIMPSGASRTTR